MNRFVCVCLALTSACGATTLKVSDISTLKRGDPMNGLPFRMRRPYTVRVFERQGDGSYKQVLVQAQDLPDPDHVYTVAAEADSQSARTLEVKLREDSTLDTVHVKSDDKTADAVSAATTQASAIAGAIQSYESTKADAQIAALKSQIELAKQQQALTDARSAPGEQHQTNLIAALMARQAAEAAQRALDALPPDATASAHGDAAAALRLAEVKANQAAQKAGLPLPYPGVGP